jgi:hypothetical protein
MSHHIPYHIHGGVICPICWTDLSYLAITDIPPMEGFRGNLIVCMGCAGLVVAIKTDRPGVYRLEKLTQEEKRIMQDHPDAPLMRRCQEELAFKIGGSD